MWPAGRYLPTPVLDYNFACGYVSVRNLSLILRQEHILRVFENGAEGDIWTEEG
jgi:hypothetical protein